MEKDQHIRRHVENLSANDSEPALKYLYYMYADRMMHYIYMYVRSQEVAEELTSDIFVALWEGRAKLLQVDNLEAWMYKIARFKALNYLRGDKPCFVTLDQAPLQLPAPVDASPEDELISRETAEALARAIEQLPPRIRSAFRLVREEGMKYKAAAEQLGISVKTLEARLTAAMKAIARVLSDREGKK